MKKTLILKIINLIIEKWAVLQAVPSCRHKHQHVFSSGISGVSKIRSSEQSGKNSISFKAYL